MGEPSKGIATETPEYKAERERLIKDVAAALREANPPSAAAPADLVAMFQGMFSEMAMNIAQMSHQGDKRNKPVDPKVLRARAEGQARLDALLDATRKAVHDAKEATYRSEEDKQRAIRAASPKYRAIGIVYLAEQLIVPFQRDDATKRMVPVEFFWLGEPNDAMRPANKLAERVFDEFRASRGSRTAIEQKAVKPLWVSDRGLIIEGSAPARREVATERSTRDTDLDVPMIVDPEAATVQVLGTVHSPAVQNFAGRPL